MERPLINLPARMARLPRDARGYPVPKFVEWVNGIPDFRAARQEFWVDCVKHNLCWLCGGQMGRHKAFVLGPMCAVNQINSEPPSHYDCAKFAATNCPFLTQPLAKRNTRDMPDQIIEAPGEPLKRNPGCCAIWITDTYQIFKAEVGNAGYLIQIGPASRVEFYAAGRRATFEEVSASVDSGLPLLMAGAEHQPAEAVLALKQAIATFRKLLCLEYNRRYDDVEAA